MVNNKKKRKDPKTTGTGTSIVSNTIFPQPHIPDNNAIQNQMLRMRNISPEDFQRTPAYQKVSENYKKPKVMVCTPCYCGQIHVKYMESVMRLQLVLLQQNIGFEFYTIPFDSLIPRARNACVTRFMQSPECTHLLFIDADIQFDPMSVLKMLQENKGCIVGAYPKKALDLEALQRNISKIDINNQMDMIQSSVKYAFNFKPKTSHKVERGVVEVLDAPTGFMMIQKKVIRDMIRHYPETEYINDVQAYQINQEDRFYDLFPSQVFDGRYLSEDYGFCRLWQRMGGEIYTDLTVKLNHIGQFCYYGDPLRFLKNSNMVSMSEEKPTPSTQIPPTVHASPEIVPMEIDV
tara:strand:- start:9023 stop:10066 length:1044 start_codon:yes stop_codon:yes gene_type:complete